jgi:hypothetical protein
MIFGPAKVWSGSPEEIPGFLGRSGCMRIAALETMSQECQSLLLDHDLKRTFKHFDVGTGMSGLTLKRFRPHRVIGASGDGFG